MGCRGEMPEGVLIVAEQPMLPPVNPVPLLAPILIVDDHQLVAKALSARFQKGGYQTVVFHNGTDALAYCDDNPVSAAVIDIHLPDLNGLVLSSGLRQRLGPQRPIIVVSGDTSMENLNSLQHVGATHFFSKPVKSSQLLERLKELLG
jgi:DNA-binding response OmpR family regulator